MLLGSDETGTGDYLSPIVSACVFIPMVNRSLLLKQVIGDSKRFTDKYIINFFHRNKNLFIYSWNLISQSKYNNLNKIFNANQIKLFLHYANIKNFLDKNPKIKIKKVVIDQFSTLNSIKKYEVILFKKNPDLDIKQRGVEVIWEEKAEDSYLEVGLASMVARYQLIRLLAEQSQRWGMSFPLGAATKADQAAKEFLSRFGKNSLAEVAKLKFKNTKRVFSKE